MLQGTRQPGGEMAGWLDSWMEDPPPAGALNFPLVSPADWRQPDHAV